MPKINNDCCSNSFDSRSVGRVVTIALMALATLVFLGAVLMLVSHFLSWGVVTEVSKSIGLLWSGVAAAASVAVIILTICLTYRLYRQKQESIKQNIEPEVAPTVKPPQHNPTPLLIPQPEPPKKPIYIEPPAGTPFPRASSTPPPQPSMSTSSISSTPPKDVVTLIAKTLSGASFDFYAKKGVTVKQAIEDFRQQYPQIKEFKFIFSGLERLDTTKLEEIGNMDVIEWLSSIKAEGGTVFHIILQEGHVTYQENIQQEPAFHLMFGFMNGHKQEIDVYPNETLGECSAKLLSKRGLNPATTILRISFAGKCISTPDRFNVKMTDLHKELNFYSAATINAMPETLSPQECDELCTLLEKSGFPQFKRQANTEKTLETVRQIIWSACDRVLRRRPGAGSRELEEQLKVLNEILSKQKTAFRGIGGYVSALREQLYAAYNIYASDVGTSYDELLDTLQQQLTPANREKVGPEVKGLITLHMGQSTLCVKRSILCSLSRYFVTLLKGNFKEGQKEIDEIELEGHSPHLFSYFHGAALDLPKLTYQELGNLYATADALTFNELSFMCQKEMITRLRTAKTLSKEEKRVFRQTPLLHTALRIWLGEQLYESADLGKIKAQIGPAPKIDVPKVDKDCQITLKMPSGNRQILKSQLIRCDYFRALINGPWKDSGKNEMVVEADIPEELFVYLEGSKAYEKWGWDKVKEVIPFAEYYALPELSHHLKTKVCDALLEARKNRLKKNFCEICIYLRKEIEQGFN